MTIIVGLGNPGKEYKNTRHNLGWLFLETLQNQSGLEFTPWKKLIKVKGEISQSLGKKFLLLKPQTFMNESGQSVSAALRYYKIKPANLVVAHDDLDLPVGSFKIQTNRGAAGHHGVESIIASLGTKNFTRLRLGIKPLKPTRQDKNFVLSSFSKEEKQLVSKTIDKIIHNTKIWDFKNIQN